MGKYGDLNENRQTLRAAHLLRWVALGLLILSAVMGLIMAYVTNVWLGLVATVFAAGVCLIISHALAYPYNGLDD